MDKAVLINKFNFLLVINLLCLSSYAGLENSPLTILSSQVNQLVVISSTQLDSSEKKEVKNLLIDVKNIFERNGMVSNTPTGFQSLFCESTHNILINLENKGEEIYDFSDRHNCIKAKSRLESGKLSFCDDISNSFVNYKGQLIYDFNEIHKCEETLYRMDLGKKRFCDLSDNSLRSIVDGSLIYDFSSRQDCLAALD